MLMKNTRMKLMDTAKYTKKLSQFKLTDIYDRLQGAIHHIAVGCQLNLKQKLAQIENYHYGKAMIT